MYLSASLCVCVCVLVVRMGEVDAGCDAQQDSMCKHDKFYIMILIIVRITIMLGIDQKDTRSGAEQRLGVRRRSVLGVHCTPHLLLGVDGDCDS